MEKKFAIVSTWNGEGYSYQNKIELVFIGTEAEAKDKAKVLMYETQGQNINIKERENGFIFNFKDNTEDSGSFQIFELTDDSYGIVISCLVNEVEILNKMDFHERLEQAIIDNMGELDDEDFEGFTVFIPNEDEDLQFIELK